jgi:hypothetical protein
MKLARLLLLRAIEARTPPGLDSLETQTQVIEEAGPPRRSRGACRSG